MGYGRSYIIGSFNVRNLSENTKARGNQIAEIIKKEQMDIIALQEVLGKKGYYKKIALKDIMECLNRSNNVWDCAWEPASGISGDQRGEGYAFIWKTTRLKKVETEIKTDVGNEQIRVFEPRIWKQYRLDKNLGQKKLVRNPFYGRFTPSGLGGGNFEIRLITTHIRFDGEKGENDPSYHIMRKNELKVLTQNIYAQLEDKRYGVGMPAYTILLGDYNLNLKNSGASYPHIDQSDEQAIIIDGPNIKKIITVQSELTTLKRSINNLGEDISNDPEAPVPSGYANNYDHFSYDINRLDAVNPRYRAANIIENGRYTYRGDYEKYKKEVSDHIPIIITLTPNVNDLPNKQQGENYV